MDAATLAACLGCPTTVAVDWLPHLDYGMSQYDIDTPARQAAFLAQIGHESGGLKWLTELWGPTPAQRQYEPPADKARELGNTESGDGFRFRGRGLIQVTGRANYDAVGAALCLDCIRQPELLAEPEFAPLVAAWWWAQHGLNALADAGDFEAITRRINGGLNGYDDRLQRWAAAKQVLGVTA